MSGNRFAWNGSKAAQTLPVYFQTVYRFILCFDNEIFGISVIYILFQGKERD